jgi:hypothetical protein
LCGEVAPDGPVAAQAVPSPDDLQTAANELAAIRAEQARLVAQIEELRATVARIGAAFGERKEG